MLNGSLLFASLQACCSWYISRADGTVAQVLPRMWSLFTGLCWQVAQRQFFCSSRHVATGSFTRADGAVARILSQMLSLSTGGCWQVAQRHFFIRVYAGSLQVVPFRLTVRWRRSSCRCCHCLPEGARKLLSGSLLFVSTQAFCSWFLSRAVGAVA